jgi:hypothetical protein
MTINTHKENIKKLTKLQKAILWIAVGAGSIQFLFFCVLLTITPFGFPKSMPCVLFISSSFLQLVLLPIILFKQNIDSKHEEIKANHRYEVEIKSEQEIEEIKGIVTDNTLKLDSIIEYLKEKENGVNC